MHLHVKAESPLNEDIIDIINSNNRKYFWYAS